MTHGTPCPRVLAGRTDLGQMAFLSGHKLDVLDLASCRVRTLVGSGAQAPVRFSADGRYLAYGDGSVVAVAGGSPTRPLGRLTTGWLGGSPGWAWSPHGHQLAGVTSSGGVMLGGPGAHGRRLLEPSGWGATSVAWEPDGRALAVSRSLYGRSAAPYHQAVWLLDLRSGSRRLLLALHKPTVAPPWLAGFSPSGRWLLAWEDSENSSSLAADGVPLVAIPVAGAGSHVEHRRGSGRTRVERGSGRSGGTRAERGSGRSGGTRVERGRSSGRTGASGAGAPVIASELIYSDFLSWCPGDRLAYVLKNGGRQVTLGDRIKLTWLPPPQQGGTPTKTGVRTGLSFISPACAPQRRTLIAAAVGPASQDLPFGAEHRSIWLARAGGAWHALEPTPPADASDELPMFSRDGRFIAFIRTTPHGSGATGSLYLLDLAGGSGGQPAVVGPIADLGATGDYYGHYGWATQLAWHRGSG